MGLPLLVQGAALMALVIVAYLRVFGHGFIWDDDINVTANPRIIGPQGLVEIWTTAAANYFPLVLTNFWVQHAVWGLNPAGFHAVTLLFHVACAGVLWRVLLALRIPGAWLGAALWALHPVQVESAAWITELKNTQSGLFFLLSILFWVKWLEVGRGFSPPLEHLPTSEGGLKPGSTFGGRHLYILALFFGLLALLSKPSTVMLPVALVLCAWWRHGAFRRRDWLAAAPLFLLAAITSGWAIWEQRIHSGASGVEWNQTPIERIAIAGKTAWFYLGKLLWPHPLAFIYPRWATTATLVSFGPFLAAVVALAVLWRVRDRWRPAFFAGMYFVALLFPVLGFFNVFFFRYSFVGDHFQYLASIGPLVLLGAVLTRLPRGVFLAAAAVLIAGLGALTWRQSAIYHNNITLWQATVIDNPRATMAWMNLGDSFSRAGRHQEAIDSIRGGLALHPNDPDAHSDLGCELVLVGRPAEAVPELEEALRLRPDNPESHNNYGNALWALGRREEGLREYLRAIELRPNYGEAHNNLGAALVEMGRAPEALPHFATALRVNPKHVEAHDNLGNALRALGRLPEAIAEHEAALQLRPDFAEAHNNLAVELAASGRQPEAITHFQRALALKPGLVAASGGLAKALVATGRKDEALRELQASLRLAPDSAAAHNNLGSFLAQSGRTTDALAELEQAARLDPKDVSVRLNLGTALASAQRWLDAARQFEAAAKLQPNSVEAFTNLGVALVNADRLETAALSFTRALQLNPKSPDLHDQLGQVLRALGRTREATEQLDETARLRRR